VKKGVCAESRESGGKPSFWLREGSEGCIEHPDRGVGDGGVG
jgi:hypothetical protein